MGKKGKSKLTYDERIILENIDKEYKWIAREKNGDLIVYTNEPTKTDKFWFESNKYADFVFNHLFHFIKWEDEEPYSIEELLKE